jgi:hypothetical protein
MESKKSRASSVLICAMVLLLASPVLFAFLAEFASRWRFSGVNGRARTETLLPAAAWVHAFVEGNNRLPTRAEAKAKGPQQFSGGAVTLYRRGELGLPVWGPAKDDFVIGAYTGEWNLYYCSWSKEVLEYYTE